MTYDPRRVPPEVEALVHSAFAGIPHVRVDGVRWMERDRGPHPVAITDHSYCVCVDVRGWSPSLHATHLQIDHDLAAIAEAAGERTERSRLLADMQRGDQAGVATLLHLMGTALEDDVDAQRNRAEIARRRHIAKPLRMATPPAVLDGQRIVVGHVLVDRSAAAILRDQCPDPDDPCPRRSLEHAVAVAHHVALDYDLTRHVEGSVLDTVLLLSDHEACRLDVGVRTQGGIHVRGRMLVVPSVLPETVAAACAGRPIEDVIDVGAHFAGRIVERADVWGETTRIHLRDDRISVDEAFPKARPKRRV
jgi:hypothetical protein